jgi:carboxypeptidase family protein
VRRSGLIVLLVVVGCAGLPPPLVRPMGGISGTVVDATTGARLPGALIQLRAADGKPPSPPAVSNAKGEFALMPLRDGNYGFVVEHAGYLTASAMKIGVEKGYYTTVEVKLIRGGDGKEAAPNPPVVAPVLISGPSVTYPSLAPRLHGKMLVRCVLTVEGVVKDCLPDQDVPELAPMIRQLEQRRYRPALRDGVPVEVWYVFRITIDGD